MLGGVDDGAIAGEIGLAGEDVHRLRAGDARHQFHGEGDQPGVRHLLERGFVAVRVHDGEDQRALLVGRELVGRRAAHFQDEVRVLDDVFADGRAGGLIVSIRNAGGDTGAAGDRDVGAKRLELLDGFRRGRDARLLRFGLTRYGNSHSQPLLYRLSPAGRSRPARFR